MRLNIGSVILEGSESEVINTANQLGIKLYCSSRNGLIPIDTMNTNHLINAITKHIMNFSNDEIRTILRTILISAIDCGAKEMLDLLIEKCYTTSITKALLEEVISRV